MKGKHWLCEECDYIIEDKDVLMAPNPFSDTTVVSGCPECFSIDRLARLCDDGDCPSIATFTWHSMGVWRQTCSVHYKQDEGDRDEG